MLKYSSALALLAAGIAFAQIPDGGTSLIRDGFPVGARRPTGAQIVEVEHDRFTQALRVEVQHEAGDPWSVEVGSPTTQAVQKGDIALIHFWARGLESSDETGEVFTTVYAQKNSPDWDKSLLKGFSVGAAWREFFFPFEFIDDYAAGQATINFGVGTRRQILEIAGLEVLDYSDALTLADLPQTLLTYAGREPDAPWRQEAATRIDQHRRGDFTLEIVDASGQPVAQAEVQVEMQRHAFLFGSALQMWRLTSDTAEDQTYRDKVLELFNAASNENALKWPAWDGDWGQTNYGRDKTLAGFAWLKANGLHRRGHVLVWPGWSNLPQSINRLADQADAATAIPPLVIEHIDEVTQATEDLVQEWDVINEPYTNHDIMDLSGDQVMVDWFQTARRNLPAAPLYLNDFSILSNNGQDLAHQNHYEQTIQYLLDQGAPLTGLGMQGHFGDQVTTPTKLLDLLDRFGRFGLPIKITEFDINTTDQDLLNDYTRDFMTLVFSHPAVAGLQLWGFWAKAHWRPAAALYNEDWTPRPHAQIYRDLVLQQWWTREAGQTGADGRFNARGFYGDYQVEIRHGDQTFSAPFTLRPAMEPVTIRLDAATAVETGETPHLFNLEQNYPNPFNPSTTIPYRLASPAQVRLSIYNNLGQRIKTLIDKHQPAGPRTITWDGTDQANQPAGAGTYIYELTADHRSQQKTMLLLH
ncbi:MAG: T9SS type A sorting domain-containing protein [Candidatus Latescibacteria bacterium]|nr:T9SS type A sorting domain-containing protein [Candidatus Latescibacterota bacterium]